MKLLQGGQGSGNFGHAGRPGEIGGSQPYYIMPSKEYPGNSLEEREPAVRAYTLLGYEKVNGYLRRGEASGYGLKTLITVNYDERERITLGNIIDRLDKLTLSGECPKNLLVYRGAKKKPEWMEVGSEFTDEGFISTSTSDYAALHYFGGTPLHPGIVYTIKVPKGHPGFFTGNNDEKEFLLPRGTKFRVTAIHKNQFEDPTSYKTVDGIDLEIVE